jgi:hypothetical protein
MDVFVQVLVLIWIVAFVVVLSWAHVSSRGASFAAWLGLTAVTLWLEFVCAFVLLHAILFTIGREAVVVVTMLTLVTMVLTPAAWAVALGRWRRSHAAHP